MAISLRFSLYLAGFCVSEYWKYFQNFGKIFNILKSDY